MIVDAKQRQQEAPVGDGLDHVVCCNDNVALCGADVSAAGWDLCGLECVVCLDLEFTRCPRCGR